MLPRRYFLDVRPPTLLPRYSDAMEIVWSVIDMAFSSAVITPGQTTCDDVGWWMWEAVRAAGYTCDFMPDVPAPVNKSLSLATHLSAPTGNNLFLLPLSFSN